MSLLAITTGLRYLPFLLNVWARARFRGVRLIHTHLNGELLSKEDLSDLALLQFDLVACIGERRGERDDFIHTGYLVPENREGKGMGFYGASACPGT